jgi:hypothetical protein
LPLRRLQPGTLGAGSQYQTKKMGTGSHKKIKKSQNCGSRVWGMTSLTILLLTKTTNKRRTIFGICTRFIGFPSHENKKKQTRTLCWQKTVILRFSIFLCIAYFRRRLVGGNGWLLFRSISSSRCRGRSRASFQTKRTNSIILPQHSLRQSRIPLLCPSGPSRDTEVEESR